MSRVCLVLIGMLVLAGCGKSGESNGGFVAPSQPDADGVVMKAQAVITLSTGQQAQSSLARFFLPQAMAASGNVSITTNLAGVTNFSIDSSQFNVPVSPTAFAVNDFGSLQIGTLKDNSLSVCGTSGHTHCGTALIRLYTTGTTGAGLWNSVDQYGAPIGSAQAGSSSQLSVGLGTASAAVVQQMTIPASKHTMNLSDFVNPKYDVTVDFSNAGAGAYGTTLVLEYALAP